MKPQKLLPQGFGIGTYRFSHKNPEHLDVLRFALQSGVRIIDLTPEEGTKDEALQAVSLVWEEMKNQLPEKVWILSKTGHLEPGLIESKISQHLARFPDLDVFLIHQPERFLKKEPDYGKYYGQLKEAFTYLESECKKGRIQAYGISSSSMVQEKAHPEFTSLEILWEIAESIEKEQGAPHHFRVIEFPFNLVEADAYIHNQYPGGTNLLELASKWGISTLIQRPLNAFTEKQIFRLISYSDHFVPPFRPGKIEGLENLIQLESQIPPSLIQKLLISGKPIFWGHLLKDQAKHLHDFEQWRQILKEKAWPSLEKIKLQAITEEEQSWWTHYEKQIQETFQDIAHSLETESSLRNGQLLHELAQAVPSFTTAPSLSYAALKTYASTDGIDCVLVGMKTLDAVREVLKIQGKPPLNPEEVALSYEVAQAFIEKFMHTLNETVTATAVSTTTSKELSS